MFEEKNTKNQPPQNSPTRKDREAEEKMLFGETEETLSTTARSSPNIPTIPKEFLTKKKKFPLLQIIIIVIILTAVVVFLIQWGGLKFSTEKITTPSVTPTPPSAPATVVPPPAINQIIDTDGDGLTDEQEIELGTNTQNTDSDGDGLFDFEEVKIYKTDPLNADTDKDGYKDGEEVRAGYNPKDSAAGAKLLDLMREIEKSQ